MIKELKELEQSKNNDTYVEKRTKIFLILATLFLLSIATLPAVIIYLKNFVEHFFK